jgi:single-stranded DNA-binding protein
MVRNSVRVVADVTGDIYYSNTTKDGKSTPFLRLMAVIQGSSPTPGPTPPVRIVAHGRRAEILEAFVQLGTRLDVDGHLSVRRRNDGVVIEIVCEHAEAIRYATWDRGYERIEELKAKDSRLLEEHGDFIDGLRNREEEGLPNPYEKRRKDAAVEVELEPELVSL